MTSQGLSLNTDISELHAGWFDRWCPEINDETLKASMLADLRVRSHLAKAILEAQVPSFVEADLNDEMDIDEIGSCDSPEKLREIGFAWLAPRLSICLFDKDARTACGVIKKAEIESILKFRNHLPIDKIGELPEEKDVVSEGRACAIAWLVGKRSKAAHFCLLQIDPKEIEAIDLQSERALLFSEFFRSESGH